MLQTGSNGIAFIGLNELREMFLAFFEGKGHLRMPSFPLIPKNDKSLLLINSGMAPLKPYFTGAAKPPNARVATCQKCVRTPDIDNVGLTSRHGTFFEMLGNFSFGDYFKKESIAWGWEFMTEVLKIPASLLYASVYYEDDEAYGIWLNEVGVQASRIIKLGKEDNFWEHGLGPCGPCSEIYFDRGEKYGCGKADCAPGCDCDRYIEVWNHVFTQFDRKEDGSYERLASTNIDTGMGLERLACVVQGAESIFEVDTIKSLLNSVCERAGVRYNCDFKTDVSVRIITDHIRSSTMMVADGVIPSNEGRGYVLRRLLRRAARHGRLLGVDGSFLNGLSAKVIGLSGGAYPELRDKSDYIRKVITVEEERFAQTLDQGLSIFRDTLAELKETGRDAVDGETAFRLHDTYGFPLDLTRELASEYGFTVDTDKFAVLMDGQRGKARAALKTNDASAWARGDPEGIGDISPTLFTGYADAVADAVVLCVYNGDGFIAGSAGTGERVAVVLDRTPFYAAGGGQLADMGKLTAPGMEITVNDCEKSGNGVYLHIGEVAVGSVSAGDAVRVEIDVSRRADTARNHTATHLLQAALKLILGDHVNQSGSQVGHDKFRFDFNHFEQVRRSQLDEAERIVNEKIMEGVPVRSVETSLEEARKTGAQALFGEKYGDVVRVVSAGDFSKELCGGTHVDNTGKIGLFAILGESGIAAGVRRIEAVTGREAYRRFKLVERTLADAAALAKTSPEELPQKLESIQNDLREREHEIGRLTDRIISALAAETLAGAVSLGAVKLAVGRFDQFDASGISKMADFIREREPSCVAVFATVPQSGERVDFVAAAGKAAVEAGADAGGIIREVAAAAGGKGGGRRDMARAGGKDASLLHAALEMVPDAVRRQLKI